jgi:hypothetical protein
MSVTLNETAYAIQPAERLIDLIHTRPTRALGTRRANNRLKNNS